MHEAALCQCLVDIIRDQQRQRGFRQVRTVYVEVGVLGHVEPQALAFAFEVAALDSPAAGATLRIEEIAGRAWGTDCAEHVTVERRGDPCPVCGGFGMIVEQGEELRLKELEVV